MIEENDDIIDNELPENQETITRVTGMFKDWFLDYASYVILERAVPAIEDGFKPVQRRILHSMKDLDDGRYNKVANIVGHTMQYHPHGDASIADAMVQIGQKDLLIDTQGNWGNVLTGDRAAASRYIEARLSKFALEVIFNPKITEWQASYDGRRKEPEPARTGRQATSRPSAPAGPPAAGTSDAPAHSKHRPSPTPHVPGRPHPRT
jgi:topoisomerase-4 subunit A